MEEWKGGRMEEDVLEALLQRTMRGAASFKSFQPNRANTSAFHRVLCVRLAFAVHGFTVRRRPHKRDRSISEVNSEF